VGLCSGFVYYLSVSGITGARDELPADLAQNVRELRDLTDLPICVGFGVSRRKHILALSPLADGAIVGSAIVKRMIELAPNQRQAIPQAVADYCRSLLL
jgi:tryptophan synthase alpha chain